MIFSPFFKELEILNAKLEEFKKPNKDNFWRFNNNFEDDQIKNVISSFLVFIDVNNLHLGF
jgi:hypothetical protein